MYSQNFFLFLSCIILLIIIYIKKCNNVSTFMGKPWFPIRYDPNLYPNPDDINLASRVNPIFSIL